MVFMVGFNFVYFIIVVRIILIGLDFIIWYNVVVFVYILIGRLLRVFFSWVYFFLLVIIIVLGINLCVWVIRRFILLLVVSVYILYSLGCFLIICKVWVLIEFVEFKIVICFFFILFIIRI